MLLWSNARLTTKSDFRDWSYSQWIEEPRQPYRTGRAGPHARDALTGAESRSGVRAARCVQDGTLSIAVRATREPHEGRRLFRIRG